MTTLPLRMLGACTLFATASAQAAPPKQCLAPSEIRALVLFVVPKVIETAASKCSSSLPQDSYLLTAGLARADEIRANRMAALADAKSAFAKFAGRSGDNGADMMANLPDETIVSLVEDGLAQELVSDFKTSACADIEQIARPLAPLPNENLVDFLAATFVAASRNDRDIGACPGG